MRAIFDWLDNRTGYRAAIRHLLDEQLPGGTGWWFTTGSILLFLLVAQTVTGIGLSMYYVPSPALAYDSVRFITNELAFGWLMRGLHFWGASFVVVAAGVHLLRVFLFGSYKAPREVTWLSGVVLLLLILGLALSGYLLPWDQKAYWATTVTINIARSTPLVGEYVAAVMRGGSDLGALTLGRWYSAHVFLLPIALIVFIVAHIALMRRHGISGPIYPRAESGRAFYPWHAMKDTLAVAAIFALLFTIALGVPAHLDEIANPADASYIPRPDWYFLFLFQLLKYFPGPLELAATMILPGLAIGFLIAVPFLDRGRDRHPLSRSRRVITAVMVSMVLGVITLTALGLRDMPSRYDPNDWSPRALAGYQLVATENTTCVRCHVSGGPAAPLAATRITRDEEWLLTHMADPVVIAPGVRAADDPAPPSQMTRLQSLAVVSYLRRLRAGGMPPPLSAEDRIATSAFGSMCVGCHKIAGEGGDVGPDLSRIGSRRDASSIRQIITDATSVFPETVMPVYGEHLSEHQIDALVQYLSRRR